MPNDMHGIFRHFNGNGDLQFVRVAKCIGDGIAPRRNGGSARLVEGTDISRISISWFANRAYALAEQQRIVQLEHPVYYSGSKNRS